MFEIFCIAVTPVPFVCNESIRYTTQYILLKITPNISNNTVTGIFSVRSE